MTATAELLANVPFFRDLPKDALKRLEKLTSTRTFPAGRDIVKEGDEGVGFFLITEGKVEVSRAGKTLSTLGEGDFFGEMALLDHHRRSATVRAVEPTSCLGMLRSDFVAELRANPDIAIEMLAVMSRRIRELDQRVSD
jgi:CRP-like cAMP-binding protein